MLRSGHLGAALLAYSPVGVALSTTPDSDVAVQGALLVVALASVPDDDVYVPGLRHRGVTHSLPFVAVTGAVGGVAATLVVPAPGPCVEWPFADGGVRLAATHSVGIIAGVLATLAHIGADALTPAGVPLLWPLTDERYSLGLWPADDLLANAALVVAGLLATVAWAWPILAELP